MAYRRLTDVDFAHILTESTRDDTAVYMKHIRVMIISFFSLTIFVLSDHKAGRIKAIA